MKKLMVVLTMVVVFSFNISNSFAGEYFFCDRYATITGAITGIQYPETSSDICLDFLLRQAFIRDLTDSNQLDALVYLCSTPDGKKAFRHFFKEGYEKLSYEEKYTINRWQVEYRSTSAIEAKEIVAGKIRQRLNNLTSEDFDILAKELITEMETN